jgi:hypothetical protein
MKQGEESAAVEKNQAQSRQRREDFFGHRKRAWVGNRHAIISSATKINIDFKMSKV